MVLTLDPAQQVAVERALSEETGGVLITSPTGSGKTAVAIHIFQNDSRVLIISPLSVRPNWRKHVEELTPLLFFEVDSSKQGVLNQQRMARGEPGVYWVTKTYAVTATTSLSPRQKDDGTWTKGRDAKWLWNKIPAFDTVLLDESHAISNRDSRLFKIVKEIRTSRKVAMSATPAGSRFDGIWSTCRWLWPKVPGPSKSGYLVDTSKNRWVAQWCRTEYNPWTGTYVPVEEKTPGAWLDSLPCVLFWEGEQKQNPTPEVVYVELYPVQRKAYRQMEDSAVAWLDENPLVADLPPVKWGRLMQLSLGEMQLPENGDTPEFVVGGQSAKLDALVDLMAEDDQEPWLILLESQKFIRVILDRLPGAVEWSGKVDKDARDRALEGLGRDHRFLVATFASISEGTDGLQHRCKSEVWLEVPRSNVLASQVEGRLDRRGQEGRVRRVHIKAVNTLDDGFSQEKFRQRAILRESGVMR